MKKIIHALILTVILTSSVWAQAETIDLNPEQMRKEVILYQLEVTQHTMNELQMIFDQFNDTFIDYQPAIDRVSILINNYQKVMHRLPIPIPEDGEKLDDLVNKLLSRMERYYMYCKQTGRQHPYLNFQIHQAMFEVLQERERLVFKYM